MQNLMVMFTFSVLDLIFKSFVSKINSDVKSVCIQSYSGPYFPIFGPNTERYRVLLAGASSQWPFLFLYKSCIMGKLMI